VDGIVNVCDIVFSHFATHFKGYNIERHGLDNLHFHSLTTLEGADSTKPFTVDEVKVLGWDYDSFKSRGLDDINFGFIKEFWANMKDDIIRFITDFHRNGRLTKSINCTFIVLIPKNNSPWWLNDFQPIFGGKYV